MAPISLDLHVFSIVKLALGIFALYIPGSIIYNLFFHPLRKFPGPFWHKVNYVAYCYRLFRGTLALDVCDMHEKYGPIVRVAPDSLSFIDADAWKDIYGHRTGSLSGTEEMPKNDVFYYSKGMPRSIINETRENHAVLRRHLSHGFSDRSMRQQEPIIGSYVDLLIRRLREKCVEDAPSDHGYSDSDVEKKAPVAKRRRAIDIKTWYNWTTFDIIGDLAFGEPFGCLENTEYNPWVKTIANTVKAFGAMQALKFIGLERVLRLILTLGLARAREEHFRRTDEKLRRRMSLNMERPDLIEGLLKVKNMEKDRIRVNASTLIIAGSETTATQLAGVTFLLLSNRDKLERLTREVRGSFGSDSEITLTSVGRLSYMLACLDEGMRRYPPVAIGMPRTVPKGGANIAGTFVPEKSVVAVWQLAAYSNSHNFSDPKSFRPERFSDPESRDKFDALQPFSVGPRNCIGKNLAYSEMRLILAKLLFNFDIELVDKDIRWLDQKVFILWDKPPLDVYLTPVTR